MIRPALAAALAAVTDRPVGHWIAELKSPAFRGGWDVVRFEGAARLWWRVETDFGHKTTQPRGAALTIADPAEALEAMIARGVLPQSFMGDVSRAFWRDYCNGKHWPEPRTLMDLLAWASLGAATIVAAEQLACETAARLRPWGVRPPVETATTPDGQEVERERPWRVVWRVGTSRLVGLAHTPKGWPRCRMNPAPLSVQFEVRDTSPALPMLPEYLQHIGMHAESWPTTDPRPNPYAPLLDLHLAGIALDAIDGDALVLVCPPLQGEVHRG